MVPSWGNSKELHFLFFKETESYGNHYFRRHFIFSQSMQAQEWYEIICENFFFRYLCWIIVRKNNMLLNTTEEYTRQKKK